MKLLPVFLCAALAASCLAEEPLRPVLTDITLQWGDAHIKPAQVLSADPDAPAVGKSPAQIKADAMRDVLDAAVKKCFPDANGDIFVHAAQSRGDDLVVLSRWMYVSTYSQSSALKGYRVTCYSPNGKEKWAARFAAHWDNSSDPGVRLLSAVQPAAIYPDITPIALAGEEIIICAGPRQDILCMNGQTGEVRWKVERPWEFQRGFIGPSVWSHFVGRFGLDDEKGTPAKREAFDRQWQAQIAAGPVVVPPMTAYGQKTWQIFVVVSRGPKEQWSAQRADSSVCEFDSDGRPLSVAHLPRAVQGSKFRALDGGVLWLCQNNGTLRLRAARQTMTMRPGGPDCVTQIASYQEPDEVQIDEHWLMTEKSGDPAAFGETQYFRLPVGGYVPDKNGKLFLLPITAADYTGGKTQTLLLRVPLTDAVPAPKANYRGVVDSYRTRGPYLLGITGLEVKEGQLWVTLGMEKWAAKLAFPIPVLSD